MKTSAIILLMSILLCGCAQPFFRSIQGTSTSIGISIPNEEILQLEALHYLNGEKVTVKDPANISYEFKTSETNSYLGIVKTHSFRESKLKVNMATNSIPTQAKDK